MNLLLFAKKRFVLILRQADGERVVRGTTTYEQDPELGAVLRISPWAEQADSMPEPEIILQEQTWEGTIVPDDQFGCDYSVELSV